MVMQRSRIEGHELPDTLDSRSWQAQLELLNRVFLRTVSTHLLNFIGIRHTFSLYCLLVGRRSRKDNMEGVHKVHLLLFRECRRPKEIQAIKVGSSHIRA